MEPLVASCGAVLCLLRDLDFNRRLDQNRGGGEGAGGGAGDSIWVALRFFEVFKNWPNDGNIRITAFRGMTNNLVASSMPPMPLEGFKTNLWRMHSQDRQDWHTMC